jgi:hypothetical protein
MAITDILHRHTNINSSNAVGAPESVHKPWMQDTPPEGWERPDVAHMSPERSKLEQAMNAATVENALAVIDPTQVSNTLANLRGKALISIEKINQNVAGMRAQMLAFEEEAERQLSEQRLVVSMVDAALAVPTPADSAPAAAAEAEQQPVKKGRRQ